MRKSRYTEDGCESEMTKVMRSAALLWAATVAVEQIARQRLPGVQAVVQGLGRGTAVVHAGTLQLQPCARLFP